MLGQKPKKRSLSDSSVTILTPGCSFEGKLYCRGSSRIGGKVQGEIISEGLLIIEEDAEITASVKAEEVVIQGRLKGELRATERVEITTSGKFDGDLFTPSLVIIEGAVFNGTMKMGAEATQNIESISSIERNAKKGAPTLTKAPEACA